MHVFIIPDGNRRWAQENQKPFFAGHQAGIAAMENILSEALRLPISHLTCWALSLDNIKKRPKEEVEFLFSLLADYFRKLGDSKEVHEKEVRVRAIGRWRQFCPSELREAIEYCASRTENYIKLQLTILVAYSGIDEMVMAVNKIKRNALWNGIDSRCVKNYLWTRDLPDVDLMIRTGGEPHLSDGALMWLAANAHLYLTDTYWPDFTPEEFKRAVEEFMARKRRYGG
ncbi:MAG: di-trans,poly-cis-decaprenylcistransferase [Candidatus Wildermuthbacteria bacterium RIFCSPLOWO2_02_FULL_47_10]|nr:MAG: di-trans,poly-cis-decaprenylcistransferase [Candidatus Wildermuthbacteria bacterium RIFCSPLOWO2_02_FULL_47_10]